MSINLESFFFVLFVLLVCFSFRVLERDFSSRNICNWHVLSKSKERRKKVTVKLIPLEYNLQLEVLVLVLSNHHPHDLWTDKDPKSFYSNGSPILSIQIQVKLISHLSRFHNALQLCRMFYPFIFSYDELSATKKTSFEQIKLFWKRFKICFTSNTNRACNTEQLFKHFDNWIFSLLLLKLLSVSLCK